MELDLNETFGSFPVSVRTEDPGEVVGVIEDEEVAIESFFSVLNFRITLGLNFGRPPDLLFLCSPRLLLIVLEVTPPILPFNDVLSELALSGIPGAITLCSDSGSSLICSSTALFAFLKDCNFLRNFSSSENDNAEEDIVHEVLSRSDDDFIFSRSIFVKLCEVTRESFPREK